MKKKVAALAVLALALTVGGCGGNAKQPENGNKTTTAKEPVKEKKEPEKKETPAKKEEPAKAKNDKKEEKANDGHVDTAFADALEMTLLDHGFYKAGEEESQQIKNQSDDWKEVRVFKKELKSGVALVYISDTDDFGKIKGLKKKMEHQGGQVIATKNADVSMFTTDNKRFKTINAYDVSTGYGITWQVSADHEEQDAKDAMALGNELLAPLKK